MCFVKVSIGCKFLFFFSVMVLFVFFLVLIGVLGFFLVVKIECDVVNNVIFLMIEVC